MLTRQENGHIPASYLPRRVVPLYPKLRPGPRTDTAQSVASNQRARLYGAMIELTAIRGYEASTVSELCALAGVSKRTLYERFPGGKEQCFLATYDIVAHRAQTRILSAAEQRAKDAEHLGPCRRLRVLAEELGREVAAYPNAARLVLVEALLSGPAGPTLSERTERTRRLAEQVIAHSLRTGPSAPAPPPSVLKAIVQEGTRLVRKRLGEGRIEELGQELAEVCVAAVPPIWQAPGQTDK
jgi:AcrR family transcriptional regulator